MKTYTLFVLAGLAVMSGMAKASDGQREGIPLVGLAVVKNAVPGSYTAAVCVHESEEWKLDYFETATFTNPYRQSLSETFANGSADGSTRHLVVTFSDHLSDVGGLDVFLHLQGGKDDGYLGIIVRLTDIFWSGKFEEHVIKDYPTTAKGWCPEATKIKQSNLSFQRREKID